MLDSKRKTRHSGGFRSTHLPRFLRRVFNMQHRRPGRVAIERVRLALARTTADNQRQRIATAPAVVDYLLDHRRQVRAELGNALVKSLWVGIEVLR